MAFIIKEHRPGRWRIILAVVVSLWVASAWLAYETGWSQSNHDFSQAESRQKKLQKELDEFRALNDELQARVSRLQRTAQVDREAKVELAKEVKNFQDQQAELREELSFYKGIISPDEGDAGLRIYSLSIMQAEGSLYHYKLVLTQSGKNDSLAKGGVKITIQGISEEKEKNLDLNEIQLAESGQLSYKFRYFQELSGSFRLPEHYIPREVSVRLTPRSGKVSNKLVRTFDWHEVRL
ncbi:MAG: OmpH family outer membrane protein [Gammaproteobacteria bacterium]|nr:OmpH family outer membrane protein [Gammaproteobacteria bacterium]